MPDRRERVRFEIVGRLRGSVLAESTMLVRNISRGGALVESAWPLQPGALHTVRLESDQRVGTLQARVCHVSEHRHAAGYLIGLEFVAIDAPALDDIDRIVHRLPGSASTEAH